MAALLAPSCEPHPTASSLPKLGDVFPLAPLLPPSVEALRVTYEVHNLLSRGAWIDLIG
jgi:hypothetical protein